LEDVVKRQVERAIEGIMRNTIHAQKWPISSTRCTSGDSEDGYHQCHQFLERQHETHSALESNEKQVGIEQMKSFKLRLERIEKDMMEVSVGLGARFESLADSVSVVEQNVQGLFVQ